MKARHPLVQLFAIATPLIAQGVVTIIVTVNDTVLLGRASAEALASAAAASSVTMVCVMLLSGLVSVPTQILVARAVGAEDLPGAAKAAERVVPLAVASALLLAVLVFVFSGPLATVVGGSAVDVSLMSTMLWISALSLLPTGLLSVARGYVTGRGNTRIVFIASLMTAIIDVALSLALVPLIGPLGATIGTAVAPVAGLAVYLIGLRRADAAPGLLGAIRIPSRAQRESLSLGWSEAILGGTSAGAGVVVTVLLSASGAAVLASSRAMESMSMILWVVMSSFASAGLTMMATARGADSRPDFMTALRAMLTVQVIAGIVIAVVMTLLTVPLLNLTVGERIAAEASGVVLISWAQVLWIAPANAALSVTRAFRDTRTPLFVSLASEYIVFLPAGILFCRVLGLGLLGLYIAHHLYWITFLVIAGIVALRHLRRPWEVRGKHEAASNR